MVINYLSYRTPFGVRTEVKATRASKSIIFSSRLDGEFYFLVDCSSLAVNTKKCFREFSLIKTSLSVPFAC